MSTEAATRVDILKFCEIKPSIYFVLLFYDMLLTTAYVHKSVHPSV